MTVGYCLQANQALQGTWHHIGHPALQEQSIKMHVQHQSALSRNETCNKDTAKKPHKTVTNDQVMFTNSTGECAFAVLTAQRAQF